MKEKFLRIYPAAAALILILGLIWIQISAVDQAALAQQGIQAPQEGLLAPQFTLETLQGGRISLEELRGRPVLVNFWASWCPPCRSEMPAMEAMYQEFNTENLEILAVNLTNQDSLNNAAAFVKDNQLTFPVLLDRTGEIGDLYQINSLPTSFFIDHNGVIQKVVIGGPMQEALIYRQVNDLLEK